MFAGQEEPKAPLTRITRKWRVHGAFVLALWGMTGTWIAFERIHPPHRTESLLWMASTGLLLTAAASDAAIVWYIARAHVEPVNDAAASFRMGYRAGYADSEASKRTNLYLLPDPRMHEQHTGLNGTLH